MSSCCRLSEWGRGRKRGGLLNGSTPAGYGKSLSNNGTRQNSVFAAVNCYHSTNRIIMTTEIDLGSSSPAEEETPDYCSDGWHGTGYCQYYIYKSYQSANAFFSCFALNTMFCLLAMNAFFSILSVNSFMSLMSVVSHTHKSCFKYCWIIIPHSTFSISHTELGIFNLVHKLLYVHRMLQWRL